MQVVARGIIEVPYFLEGLDTSIEYITSMILVFFRERWRIWLEKNHLLSLTLSQFNKAIENDHLVREFPHEQR